MGRIAAFTALERALGQENATLIAEYIESKQNDLATKNDLKLLVGDFKKEMTDLKGDLKKDISDLKIEIRDSKIDLIKWFAAALLAQAGLITALLKFMS